MPPSAQLSEAHRVWLFHSHAYFDHESAECVAEARGFMERIRTTFASSPHLEVHSFISKPVGPHPRGSFEVQFTRAVLAEYLSWLLFERPPRLSVLVHPLTKSQVLDHTARAVWLGEPLVLERSVLEAADAEGKASGVSRSRRSGTVACG
jgi:DOPA 4,5-dioxygenase